MYKALNNKIAEKNSSQQWYLLHLHLDEESITFLNKPSTQWADDDSFYASTKKVKSIVSVNDIVKLGSDNWETSLSEDMCQANLQVVRNNKKSIPDLKRFVQKLKS